MIKFIKESFFLTEEDKLYMLPWYIIKWFWEDPHAYRFKGTMRIDEIHSQKHWWNRKRPVNQPK
jgi:hypothetical protein